jgi:thioredoxin 1
MKETLYLLAFLAVLFFLFRFQNSLGQNNLAVKDFEQKIKNTPKAQLVDVRTPQEYKDGHLANALNVNWNANDFVEKVSFLDKDKPVFVYCLAGGRSASACSKLQSLGFKEVYNMEGGIAKWKSQKLPLDSDTKPKNEGMSQKDFEKIISQKKLVLIDFTAEWCAPCKKLKPILEKIAKENPQIAVIPVDYDQNPTIAETYKVDALPMLMIFENGKKTWQNQGFLDEKAILKAIK